MGKTSWQLGAKEYYKVTPYNKPHTRALLGTKNPGGWLSLLQQEAERIEQKTGFIQGFRGRGVFHGGLGLEGLWPDLEDQGLVGFYFSAGQGLSTGATEVPEAGEGWSLAVGKSPEVGPFFFLTEKAIPPELA